MAACGCVESSRRGRIEAGNFTSNRCVCIIVVSSPRCGAKRSSIRRQWHEIVVSCPGECRDKQFGSMAVHVSIGQCGNQIAGEFWRAAQAEFGSLDPHAGSRRRQANDAAAVEALVGKARGHVAGTGAGSGSGSGASTTRADQHIRNPLYDDRGFGCAVLVDSEPKVLQGLTNPRSSSYVATIHSDDMVYDQSGR